MANSSKPIPRGPIGMRLCNELDGLLRGVGADGLLLPQESARVAAWLEANHTYTDVHPFGEIASRLERALSDNVLTTEEVEDLLFVVSKYTTVNPYFDQIRAGLQVLMGLLSAYASDSKVPPEEIRHLHAWINEWRHLRGLWPYDECAAVVTWIVSTGRIPEEAAAIVELAKCVPVSGAPESDFPALTIAGICAVQPSIEFAGRQFVFTGESRRAERQVMEGHVVARNGRAHGSVTKAIDYLVVCDDGSEHWAFSCYGRKVEKAFAMRREGHRVQIVQEKDFWQAIGS